MLGGDGHDSDENETLFRSVRTRVTAQPICRAGRGLLWTSVATAPR